MFSKDTDSKSNSYFQRLYMINKSGTMICNAVFDVEMHVEISKLQSVKISEPLVVV